jgi:S-adenosylmethionine decarboxylase
VILQSLSRSGTPTMPPLSTPEKLVVTLDMCMTRLDKKRASIFFKASADGYTSCAKEMTKLSGISDIILETEICD